MKTRNHWKLFRAFLKNYQALTFNTNYIFLLFLWVLIHRPFSFIQKFLLFTKFIHFSFIILLKFVSISQSSKTSDWALPPGSILCPCAALATKGCTNCPPLDERQCSFRCLKGCSAVVSPPVFSNFHPQISQWIQLNWWIQLSLSLPLVSLATTHLTVWEFVPNLTNNKMWKEKRKQPPLIRFCEWCSARGGVLIVLV